MRKFVLTHFPAILIALVIFTLSSIPKLTPPDLGLKMQDKIFHVIAYFVFGITLVHSAHFIFKNRLVILVFVVTAGLVYAALDEWHQAFVPGRMSSVYDFFADGIGILLAVPLIFVWFRHVINRYRPFFY